MHVAEKGLNLTLDHMGSSFFLQHPATYHVLCHISSFTFLPLPPRSSPPSSYTSYYTSCSSTHTHIQPPHTHRHTHTHTQITNFCVCSRFPQPSTNRGAGNLKHCTNMNNNEDRFSKCACLHILRQFFDFLVVCSFFLK